VIIGLLVEYTKSYMNVNASQMLPFIVLVAILIVKPYGLFGQVRIERV
jgi:branched-chain amino acid transport system permease protein